MDMKETTTNSFVFLWLHHPKVPVKALCIRAVHCLTHSFIWSDIVFLISHE